MNAMHVRRLLVLVPITTITLCGLFAARAVAAFTAPPPALPPTPAPAPRAAVAPPPAHPAGDLARLFPSAATATGHPAGRSHSVPAELIATSLGTIRYATVRVTTTEVQGTWAAGETIPGIGRIARIGGTSIDVVDDHGARATLSLLGSTAAGFADAPAATDAREPAAASSSDPFADRITKLGEGRYEVDRALVRELVTGAARPGGVRMVPITKDGEVAGVRVLGARPGSVAAALGLKTGDVLYAIDGDPIKTAQQLLDLYAKLDQLSGVELQGKRGGKPLAITLQLR